MNVSKRRHGVRTSTNALLQARLDRERIILYRVLVCTFLVYSEEVSSIQIFLSKAIEYDILYHYEPDIVHINVSI